MTQRAHHFWFMLLLSALLLSVGCFSVTHSQGLSTQSDLNAISDFLNNRRPSQGEVCRSTYAMTNQVTQFLREGRFEKIEPIIPYVEGFRSYMLSGRDLTVGVQVELKANRCVGFAARQVHDDAPIEKTR